MSNNKFNQKPIGDIGNYYGGLYVMEHEGKYYWMIQDYNDRFNHLPDWSEIEKELYEALIKHEEKRKQ